MATTKQTPESKQEPRPGEICPCCGRKVPANAKPKMSPEEQKDRRREYNQREDVITRRRAYNAKRNVELRQLRDLQRSLNAQAGGTTADVDSVPF